MHTPMHLQNMVTVTTLLMLLLRPMDSMCTVTVILNFYVTVTSVLIYVKMDSHTEYSQVVITGHKFPENFLYIIKFHLKLENWSAKLFLQMAFLLHKNFVMPTNWMDLTGLWAG